MAAAALSFNYLWRDTRPASVRVSLGYMQIRPSPEGHMSRLSNVYQKPLRPLARSGSGISFNII